MAKGKNKLMKYLNEVFKLRAGIDRLFFFALILFILTHIVACLFYFLAKLDDLSPETWVVKYNLQDQGIVDVI
jgi:hypothetical protein